MMVCGQLRAPAALPPLNSPPVPTSGIPETVWTFGEEKNLTQPGFEHRTVQSLSLAIMLTMQYAYHTKSTRAGLNRRKTSDKKQLYRIIILSDNYCASLLVVSLIVAHSIDGLHESDKRQLSDKLTALSENKLIC